VAEPDRLLIPYADFDDRFEFVGRYGDGHQFMAFVTGAFPADWWSGKNQPEYLRNCWMWHKRWYAVIHRFDGAGSHIGTDAWSGGTTADGEKEAMERAERMLEELLTSLGERRSCDIAVRPFAVEIDGYRFGLIYKCVDADDPENPGAKNEYVMLEPNDIMFHAPWDSGEYST
jgi:formate hydrogenlyase regulatory protein HycA